MERQCFSISVKNCSFSIKRFNSFLKNSNFRLCLSLRVTICSASDYCYNCCIFDLGSEKETKDI